MATGDIYVRVYDSFGIDESRDIRDRAALHGIAGARLFILAANSLTTEAQNALLKTLEDPAADATFVFITQSPETLLPTLRSRTETLVVSGVRAAESPIDAGVFLSESPDSRIEALKSLTSADDRDTAGTLAFLDALEQTVAKRFGAAACAPIYTTRAYILDKGALRKPLLENLALALPSAR